MKKWFEYVNEKTKNVYKALVKDKQTGELITLRDKEYYSWKDFIKDIKGNGYITQAIILIKGEDKSLEKHNQKKHNDKEEAERLGWSLTKYKKIMAYQRKLDKQEKLK